MDEDAVKKLYPLHYFVFKCDHDGLKSELASKTESDIKECINAHDIHLNTPVMLATILGHVECAEALLDSGADANVQNKEMWSLSHEAILLKNPQLLRKILTLRDYQRALHSAQILRELDGNFKNSPDFYVEMTWEFTSWLPFVKNMCPSDTYKIYKHGNSIRIDANMLENPTNSQANRNSAGTGNQSFVFRFTDDDVAEIIFIDRNEKIAYMQNLDLHSEPRIEEFLPSEAAIAEKLKLPITTTYVDVDKVGFERTQKSSGLLSWIGSNEKEEEIEGYTCRAYNASNVEIVTKTCFNHLTEAEREEAMKENTNKTMSTLLGLFEKKRVDTGTSSRNGVDVYNGMSVVEYLTKPSEDAKLNIGKPKEEHIKTNAFNANLWISESFPLNLREQIFPVIDLMAVKNAKFLRLKRFIEMQMPSGFPIRIKIPIFHLINAQVTFRNVNEPCEQAIDQSASSETDLPIFALNKSLFQIPEDYEIHEMIGSLLFNRVDDVEHGENLRFNTVDVEDGGEYVYLLERFMGDQTPQTSTYEQQLQLAIEESLTISSQTRANIPNALTGSPNDANEQHADIDAELLKALEISKQEEERRQMELEEEEEQLKAILERSLLDK